MTVMVNSMENGLRKLNKANPTLNGANYPNVL